MPITNDALHPGLYDFSEPLRDRELDRIAADPAAEVLQTKASAALDTWRRIDARLLSRRPDVRVRVYGFYGRECDLGFLPLLTRLRHFAADALLGPVAGVEHLAALPASVESLSVHIRDLTDFGFLEHLRPGLRSLALGPTKSRRPTLAPLARFANLETLYLEGQQKGIEVLSGLTGLRNVTLRSISTPGLDYLRPLGNLKSLDLKLGGTRDLSAIAGMPSIRYLEVWQVRGLSDLGVIAELPGLQNLHLQSLPNVTALPSLRGLGRLRRVLVENLSGLRDFGPLEFAPALEEFVLIDGRGLDPSDLAPVLRNPALRQASAGFGSARKNRAFERMREAAGVGHHAPDGPFRYEDEPISRVPARAGDEEE